MTKTKSEYMTTAEAAALLGVKTWTVTSWAKHGLLGASVPPPKHPITGLVNVRAGWKIDRAAIETIKKHGMRGALGTERSGPSSVRCHDDPDSSIRSEDDLSRGVADRSTHEPVLAPEDLPDGWVG